MRTGLHTAEPYYHEDSSTALESTGRHASALRVTAGRFSSRARLRGSFDNAALLPDPVRGVRV